MPEQLDILLENTLANTLKRADALLEADPFKRAAFEQQLVKVSQRKRMAKLWRGDRDLDDLLGVEDLEEEGIRRLFDEIDSDQNGSIDRQELETALRIMGREENVIAEVNSR